MSSEACHQDYAFKLLNSCYNEESNKPEALSVRQVGTFKNFSSWMIKIVNSLP